MAYFTNPFSSWSEFQRQVGAPVDALYRGYKKFAKWADQSTPRPAVRPTVNQRASMQNAGGRPLTEAEMQQVIAERQQGVQNLPQPQRSGYMTGQGEIKTPEVVVQRMQQEIQKQSNPGLFSGDLRSYQSRKNWVAEHKDYLKEKGANINWDNYSGTAEQNLALKRLLGGFDAWNAAKQKAAPTISPAEKFVKDGYASGRPWQDAELQNMEGSSALYLNPEDYNRWRQLQFGQVQPAEYVAPAAPVLNANAPRKDIYNLATAQAPYAQVNPIVAAKKVGGKVVKDEKPAGGIKKVGDTTYEQKNDSTFIWDGPNNSKGKVQFYPVSQKEPEVTYRQYDRNSGEIVLVPITDPAIRQQHIENTQSGGFKKPNVIQRLYRKYRGYGEFKRGGSINYQKVFR